MGKFNQLALNVITIMNLKQSEEAGGIMGNG